LPHFLLPHLASVLQPLSRTVNALVTVAISVTSISPINAEMENVTLKLVKIATLAHLIVALVFFAQERNAETGCVNSVSLAATALKIVDAVLMASALALKLTKAAKAIALPQSEERW